MKQLRLYIYTQGLLKNEKKQSGITLIALIVTVIILLILAGVTLFYVLGDNGIIKVAQDAKKQTEDAMKNEQQLLGELANQLKEEYGGGNGDNNQGGNTPNPPIKDETIADIVDKIQENNKTVEDANGNPIVIPGGFKVVPNSPEGTDESQKVEYSYNGDGTPAVQDGIVIEDEEGNQFVWIPVGDIKNKDGTTTTITLGRYIFDKTNGTPDLEQAAYTSENPENYTEVVTLENYFQELVRGSNNTPAKDIGEFVTKAKVNSGYYLARYEASKGTDDKVKSQNNKIAWTSITQSDAASEARRMYSENSYIETDLVNSYAWDTAIVFIQEYSKNNNYANKKPVSTKATDTGKSGDVVCNIHDMASNFSEWSTEHSTYTYASNSSYPLAGRGGNHYNGRNVLASARLYFFNYTNGEPKYSNWGFRTLVYVI